MGRSGLGDPNAAAAELHIGVEPTPRVHPGAGGQAVKPVGGLEEEAQGGARVVHLAGGRSAEHTPEEVRVPQHCLSGDPARQPLPSPNCSNSNTREPQE